MIFLPGTSKFARIGNTIMAAIIPQIYNFQFTPCIRGLALMPAGCKSICNFQSRSEAAL
jgi:hypothetical protein